MNMNVYVNVYVNVNVNEADLMYVICGDCVYTSYSRISLPIFPLFLSSSLLLSPFSPTSLFLFRSLIF